MQKYLGHQGICHRDIKPENCLLDASGVLVHLSCCRSELTHWLTPGNLKISDFGLASVFKYKGQSRLLRERCGSPPYAAPEVSLSLSPLCARPK